MSGQEQNRILLESGTNELEIVEFGIGLNRFGINVAKVREILVPTPITKLPHSHPSVSGIVQIRGEVLPVINLSQVINFPTSDHESPGFFIVSEFNRIKVIFHVESVFQIHRISWEQIEKPADKEMDGIVIGIIKMAEKLVLLLDFEKIVVDIDPRSGIQIDSVKKLEKKKDRLQKKIIVTEDSPTLQKMLESTLVESGYQHIQFFPDGKQAWDYLEKLASEKGEGYKDQIDLLITDIEMPQMDGLHLTIRIKEHSILQKLPVVIFSSLISDDLRHKGEQVGANGQVSKPEINKLVQVVDDLVL